MRWLRIEFRIQKSEFRIWILDFGSALSGCGSGVGRQFRNRSIRFLRGDALGGESLEVKVGRGFVARSVMLIEPPWGRF